MHPMTRVAGVVALAASVAVHVGLARLNPDLRLGASTRTAPGPDSPRRPVRMEEIRFEEAREEIRKLVDRFALREDTALPDELEGAPPEPDTEGLEALPSDALAGDVDAAVPDTWRPELPEFAPPALPDVLAVSEDRVREDLAFAPRTPRPAAPENIPVPDLTLPADWSRLDATSTPPPDWSRDIDPSPRAGTEGRRPLPTGPLSGGGLPEAPEPVPELPELEFADLDPVNGATELDAVERFLGLRTQSFVDPMRPDTRYFKVQVVRAGIESLPVMPRQVVFLIDTSDGMGGAMLREAVEGVRAALDTLSPSDTFNIIAFREDTEMLFQKSQPADAVRIANARGFLARLRPRGRSDIHASLLPLFDLLENDPDRPLIGLVVTDAAPTAGVTDSTEIIERFTRKNNGRVSIFSVGGGRRVNRYLIDYLSYRNRGESLVAEHARQIPDAISRTAAQIRRPVMTHLSYRFTGAEALEIYPRNLTHLYLDRSLILVGRIPADRQEVAFQIVGSSKSGQHDMVFTLDMAELPRGPWSLRQEWAWQALLHRIGEFLHTRSAETLRELRRISRDYGIALPYTEWIENNP